ncbi:MAG: hypothetical protein EBS56_04450 [Planctomycetia bacterium]|nr:hypothetical protein [Planctomycetia bacterium]
MVEKKPAKDVNKSAEIRRIAAAMKEKGEKPRPVVIIAQLKKQGIDVSSPQVSMVLKRMGFKPRRRRGGDAVAAAPRGGRSGGPISVEELIAAKRLVGHFGSVDRALAAVTALKRFES